MFGKKKKLSTNPEVLEAVQERDVLIKRADAARANVDRVKDELLDQYKQANGVQEGR